jgi:hypothetical protein
VVETIAFGEDELMDLPMADFEGGGDDMDVDGDMEMDMDQDDGSGRV